MKKVQYKLKKINKLIKTNNIKELINYAQKNNINYNNIFIYGNENILINAIKRNVDYEMIEYIVSKWNFLVNYSIPDTSINYYQNNDDGFRSFNEKKLYDNAENYNISPLSVAIKKNNFKVADLLLNNGADINNIPIGTFKKIINSKNSKYILGKRIKLNESLIINLICFKFFFFEDIIRYYIFNSSFVLKLLLLYKNKTKLSKEQLRFFISSEANKISISQTFYRIIFIKYNYFFDSYPLENDIYKSYKILKILFEIDTRDPPIKLFDLYTASRYINKNKKIQLIQYIKYESPSRDTFENQILSVLEKSLLNQDLEENILYHIYNKDKSTLKKFLKQNKIKLTNIHGEFNNLGINYIKLLKELWVKDKKIITKDCGGVIFKRTEFQDILFLQDEIQNDNIKLVKALLNWGISVNNSKINLLNEAIKSNNINMIKCLLNHGANINSYSEKTYFNCLSLNVAFMNNTNKKDTINYLIECRKLNNSNDNNNSNNNSNNNNSNSNSNSNNNCNNHINNGINNIKENVINKNFINIKFNINKYRNKKNYNKRFKNERNYAELNQDSIIALGQQSFELVINEEKNKSKNIMDYGIDVLINKINDYSNYLSPLIFAIQRNNRQIIEFLVEHGADVNMKIRDNYTPLGVAIFNRRLDLVQYLIEHGANIDKAFFRNELPLNIVIESNDKKVLKFLIQCGIDINNRDNESLGWYEAPLGKASLKQDIYIIKYLVESGADIKNDVLNSAVQSGNTDIVNYFIGCGANVNEKGHNYFNGVQFNTITPLYLAIVNNDLNMVECLLRCGAKINMNDQYEDSHLNGAIIAHRVDMVKYLVNWVMMNSKQHFISFTGNAYLVNKKYNFNEKYHIIYINIRDILDYYSKLF